LSFLAGCGNIRAGQPLPHEGDMAKTSAPKKPAATGMFSLKVTLRGIKPPIWRRIVVPGRTTLGDLHVAIQITMGSGDGHLHAFDVGGRRYGSPGAAAVIAHPAPASDSPSRLADITNRTVSSTDARLALAVLTTERKAA
jgi:Plasmid pRiA4b ORF-3-like protein